MSENSEHHGGERRRRREQERLDALAAQQPSPTDGRGHAGPVSLPAPPVVPEPPLGAVVAGPPLSRRELRQRAEALAAALLQHDDGTGTDAAAQPPVLAPATPATPLSRRQLRLAASGELRPVQAVQPPTLTAGIRRVSPDGGLSGVDTTGAAPGRSRPRRHSAAGEGSAEGNASLLSAEARAAAVRAQAARALAEREEQALRSSERAQAQRDTQRQAQEQAARERTERDRAAAERAAADRATGERARAERAEAARLEAGRIEDERLEAERIETERRLSADRRDAERIETERLAAERRNAERVETERRDAERLEVQRQRAASSDICTPAGPMTVQQRAARERAARERLAQERAEEQRGALERAARERAVERDQPAQHQPVEQPPAQQNPAQESVDLAPQPMPWPMPTWSTGWPGPQIAAPSDPDTTAPLAPAAWGVPPSRGPAPATAARGPVRTSVGAATEDGRWIAVVPADRAPAVGQPFGSVSLPVAKGATAALPRWSDVAPASGAWAPTPVREQGAAQPATPAPAVPESLAAASAAPAEPTTVRRPYTWIHMIVLVLVAFVLSLLVFMLVTSDRPPVDGAGEPVSMSAAPLTLVTPTHPTGE
jgi:hypothetical protein